MPRKPEVDRPIRLHTTLPETLRTKLDLILWSELEGRVPKGKYQEFMMERIKEYLEWTRLDLTPYGYPAGYFVAGPKDMIDFLERKLRGLS